MMPVGAPSSEPSVAPSSSTPDELAVSLRGKAEERVTLAYVQRGAAGALTCRTTAVAIGANGTGSVMLK